MPIFHECQRCTACCRWPGQVRVNEGEVLRLAAFLGMDERDFINRYTRLREDRTGLALNERPNGECVFLEGVDCRVQPVKPQQCRDFPNLWSFPGFEETCRAIPRLVGDDEYRRLVAEATGRRASEIPNPGRKPPAGFPANTPPTTGSGNSSACRGP